MGTRLPSQSDNIQRGDEDKAVKTPTDEEMNSSGWTYFLPNHSDSNVPVHFRYVISLSSNDERLEKLTMKTLRQIPELSRRQSRLWLFLPTFTMPWDTEPTVRCHITAPNQVSFEVNIWLPTLPNAQQECCMQLLTRSKREIYNNNIIN